MNQSGIIYLIQPVELVGVNRYKIGMSKSPTLDRVRNGYRKGTRYLCIMEVEKPLECENMLKLIFNKFFKLVAGSETFECESESRILNTFLNYVLEHIDYENKPQNEKDLYESNLEAIEDAEDKNILTVPIDAEMVSLVEDCDIWYIPSVRKIMVDKTILNDIPLEFQILCELSCPESSFGFRLLFWSVCKNFNEVDAAYNYLTKNKKTEIHNIKDVRLFDFTNNFSKNEIDLIRKYKIFTVTDLIRNKNIKQSEKENSIKCLSMVENHLNIFGTLPGNGNMALTLENQSFIIKIGENKRVSFCHPIDLSKYYKLEFTN
jgi:hypothetical protein